MKRIHGHPLEIIPSHLSLKESGENETAAIEITAEHSAQIQLVFSFSAVGEIKSSNQVVSIRRDDRYLFKIGFHQYLYQFEIPAGSTRLFFSPSTPSTEKTHHEKNEFLDFKAKYDQRQFPFNGSTQTDLTLWKEKSAKQLASVLFSKNDRLDLAPSVELIETIEKSNYFIRRYRCEYDPGFFNDFLLSIPKMTAGPLPLMVGIHGHEGEWGKADLGAFNPGHNDDFIHYFSERGWAVLHPPTMNHDLRNSERILLGEWLLDVIRSLNAALKLDLPFSKGISTCGLSTGGLIAMALLALDDRVTQGVISGSLTTFYHLKNRFLMPPSCDCGVSHYIGHFFELGDIATLIAPKAVQYQQGALDQFYCTQAKWTGEYHQWLKGGIPHKEYQYQYSKIEAAYAFHQLQENLSHLTHDKGHAIDNHKAFDWLSSPFLKS